MTGEKTIYCYICHSKAEQKGRPGFGFCPIHGWMPIHFFEGCSENQDFIVDAKEEASEDPFSN